MDVLEIVLLVAAALIAVLALLRLMRQRHRQRLEQLCETLAAHRTRPPGSGAGPASERDAS